jgi:hypothetical protein
MRGDSGAPRHVHTIAATVFLADDAIAALALSLTAAHHATADATVPAAHAVRAAASLTAALSHR